MTIFRQTCARLFAPARAPPKGLLPFVRVTHDARGLEDELFRIPVVVMDVGAVETLDHLRGAGAGFDGLEDAEGDEGATVCIAQAFRIDNEGATRPLFLIPDSSHHGTKFALIARSAHHADNGNRVVKLTTAARKTSNDDGIGLSAFAGNTSFQGSA